MLRMRWRQFSAAGIVALAAAGCGGGDSNPPKAEARSTGDSSTRPLPPPKAPPAIAATQGSGATTTDLAPSRPPAVENTAPTAVAPKELTLPSATEKSKNAKSGSLPAPALKEIDLAQFEQIIGEKRGKHVIVDNWGSWCAPCREKFPHFVELSKELGGDRVAFVAVAHEFDERGIEAARDFLRDNPGAYESFRMTTDLEEFQAKFSFEGLPRYLAFAPDGTIVINSDKFDEVATAARAAK